MDPGTDRVPVGVGQPDPGDEPAAGTDGFLDDAGIDVDEAQLGAAEQPQRPVAWHIAPGQAEVTVGAVAAHERPAEVESVRAAPYGDRYLPARRRRIAAHRLDRP